MISSQFGAEVPVSPEDLNPDHGNVIRRGSGVLVPAHAGNMVERSPNTINPDYESGYRFEYPPNSTQMFLIDGRLVPRTSWATGFDGALGAGSFAGFAGPTLPPLAGVLFGTGLALAAVAGAGLSRRGRRVRGAALGAVIGAVTLFGAAVGPWAYQKLASKGAGTVQA